MPRETKELMLGGYTAVIKTYATARELDALRGAMHGAQGASFEAQKEAEKHMIQSLVVSINGKTSDLYDFCQDNMDFASEYSVLIIELGELLTKKKN